MTKNPSLTSTTTTTTTNTEKEKEYQDCLPCKLTGALLFSGLAVYSFYQTSSMSSVAFPLSKYQKLSRLGVGLGFTALAVARMLS
ncbi:hypothetical protein HMI54_002102 [Coelomomyces lativittatus]|nr:hypothetical protein HMI54_002102 [Coelomomyces lativittatus]